MKNSVRRLAVSAMLAGVYAAVTMLLASLSYGPVQFRVAEALCVLPFFFPRTIWGLAAGCAIANTISTAGPLDVVFGTLATIAACLCISWAGKRRRGGKWTWRIFACAMPVIWNGLIIGLELAYSLSAGGAFWQSFFVCAAEVALGEAAVMFLLGLPLMLYLPKTRLFEQAKEKFNL